MTGPTRKVRRTVYDRAGGRCEICRRHGAGHVHHRRPRGLGGSSVPWINDPSNLLLLCYRCHAYVESDRSDAYDRGLLVRYGDDPSDVPVKLWRGRVRLDDIGRYHPCGDTTERSSSDLSDVSGGS